MTTNVLVVGATGFLGGKIVSSLLNQSDVKVRAMSRKGGKSDDKIEWVKADMMDPQSLARAMQGIDVLVSSANGYMKESITADFIGNKNLVEAAGEAKIKRFVFLSIVACEYASEVPHFLAKKVTEDLIVASKIPRVLVRAPAFIDQTNDYIADGVRNGRYVAIGDLSATKISYCFTDDLADSIAKAATFKGSEIENKIIEVGWSDGPKSHSELSSMISEIVGKKLHTYTVPWFVLSSLKTPARFLNELAHDMISMMLFFRLGKFVSNLETHSKFIGESPSSRDAITRWAKQQKLL